jgi:hypothetical protein
VHLNIYINKKSIFRGRGKYTESFLDYIITDNRVLIRTFSLRRSEPNFRIMIRESKSRFR